MLIRKKNSILSPLIEVAERDLWLAESFVLKRKKKRFQRASYPKIHSDRRLSVRSWETKKSDDSTKAWNIQKAKDKRCSHFFLSPHIVSICPTYPFNFLKSVQWRVIANFCWVERSWVQGVVMGRKDKDNWGDESTKTGEKRRSIVGCASSWAKASLESDGSTKKTGSFTWPRNENAWQLENLGLAQSFSILYSILT